MLNVQYTYPFYKIGLTVLPDFNNCNRYVTIIIHYSFSKDQLCQTLSEYTPFLQDIILLVASLKQTAIFCSICFSQYWDKVTKQYFLCVRFDMLWYWELLLTLLFIKDNILEKARVPCSIYGFILNLKKMHEQKLRLMFWLTKGYACNIFNI